MKTKNFFVALLLALIMPMGVTATDYQFTETIGKGRDAITLTYTVNYNNQEKAVITGFTAQLPSSGLSQLGIPELVIPASFKIGTTTYTIIGIYDNAFKDQTVIRKVTFPASITGIGNSAFEGCTLLTTAIFETTKPLSIGSSAFKDCTALANIAIPASTTTIGQDAFVNCNASNGGPSVGITKANTDTEIDAQLLSGQYVKRIVLGSGITTISDAAFSQISNLQSVTLPASLTTIGASAFQGCTSLTSVDIPANVTSIGNNAFDCGNTLDVSVNWMAPISIPSGTDPFPNRREEGHVLHIPFGVVSSYANHAYWSTFNSVQVPATYTASNGIVYGWVGDGTDNLYVFGWEGWTSQQNVTIADHFQFGEFEYTVTEIRNEAFQECQFLDAIEIPSSVTKIGSEAFLRSNLSSVTLHEGLNTIGFNAFNGSKLTSVDIPSTVTSIDAGAFNNCYALYEAVINAQITSLPSQIFQNCSNLEDVTLPSTLTEIQPLAFVGCEKLPSIIIPENVTAIGAAAFKGCTSLKDVRFQGLTPPAVDLTGNGDLFRTYDGGESDIIPHNTITLHVPLGAGAAYSASDSYWHDFNIVQEETAEIADGALRYRLHAGATEAENWAEVLGLSDESTTWLVIPESVSYGGQSFSVTAIAEASFVQKSLKYVELPPTVQSIGTRAFEENHSLTSVHISGESQLQTIGMGAFRGCDTFESINLPYSLQTIAEQAFANCTSLKWLNLPEGLATLGESAFVSCTSLETINLPTTLLSIGEKCFAGAGLKQIRIPNSNCSIGQSAFTCASLEKVTVSSDWETFPSTAFELAILTNGTTVSANFDLVVECGEKKFINMYFAQGCSNIKSVAIGSGVNTINALAFADCQNMTSVSIPASVNNIYTKAFGISNPSSYTSALTDVTVSWTTPITLDGTADHDPFPRDSEGNHTNINLHVPSGTETAYQENTYWKTFFSETHPIQTYTNITFADAQVKAVCVQNWDTNGDGELSIEEAAVVTSLEGAEFPNEITKFNELQYFTSLTAIETFAFSGCSALTEITFPSSLTTIGSFAFQSCSSLTNLVIPEGVTSIESFAFQNYTGIVTLPTTLTSIGGDSFQNAQGAKVSWPEPPAALTQDFYSAFGSQRDKLLYVPLGSYDIYDNTPTWWAFDIREYGNIVFADANVKAICVAAADGWDTNGDGELSAEEALAVNSIGTAFKGNATITSFNELKHFRSLTDIPELAFLGCTSLAGITLPINIAAIGKQAFSNTALTAIDIPEKVTDIGEAAFENCVSLASVNLPSYGLKTIGKYAFCNDPLLTRIVIPSSVTSMDNAFQNYPTTAAGNLTYVTAYFAEPIAITENTFPNRANATLFVPEDFIENYKSADYWKEFKNIISKIEFNDPKVKAICVDPARGWDTNGDGELTKDEAAAVTTLGMAFTGNTEIKTFEELKYFTGLNYNNAVPALTGGDNTHGAFDGCTNLRSVEMPANIEQIMNYSFRGCTSLANVNIPSGVHTILDYAFQGCTALSYASMPQALEHIGAHAFDGCSSLRWIAFPNQAITYGDLAFNGCSSLTQVTVNSSVPGDIDGNPFPNRSSIKLIVPPHTTDVYSNTEYWNEFQIEEQEPDWLIYTDDEGNQYQYDPGYSARLYRIATQATEFVIPATITVDGSTLPVTAIAEQGATSSYMEHLTIPASVTKLKERALFAPELKTIHIQATTPPVATQALIDWSTWMAMYNMEMRHEHPDDYQDYLKSFKDITLYVPVGTKSTYELYDTWKEFTIEEELLETGRALADVSITYDIVLPPKDDYSGWATVLPDEVNNAMSTAFQQEADELWRNIRQYASEQPRGSIMNYVVYGDELQRNDNSRFNASGDFGHWFNASGEVVNWGTDAVLYTGFSKSSKIANVGQYPGKNADGDSRTVREAIVLKDATGEEAKVVFMFNITFQTNATASATLSSIEYTWLHGDVDGTPGISINDALTIIDYILGKDVPTGFDTTKADVNGDGNVTIADATAVLAIILRQ